jgi:DNA polymerase elongation subunit (family B)
MTQPKILLLDIETAPNKAYVWGIWDQNIGLNQIESTGYVLCWSAKWLHERELMFSSTQHHDEYAMLLQIHTLLDEADIVVHYNGTKFDIPTLNKEFVKHQMSPPAPYRQVDLLQVVKKAFRFVSNKLDFVAQALGLGGKVSHEGFELWVRCMEGDEDAWYRMEAYNRHDVVLLEKLYRRLLPWIEKHPNHGVFSDVACCPKCGSKHFQARGYAVTAASRFRRYQCNDCGGWFRGNRNTLDVPKNEERMRNELS